MQELVDAIYEVYMKTDKLLGVFAVGESMTFSHFKTLCQFLQLEYCNAEEEIKSRFLKLDRDQSEHIDVHELGPVTSLISACFEFCYSFGDLR